MSKVKKCPNCGSNSIAKISYGLPFWDEKLDNAIEAGKIVLGGCCVTDHDPDYRCNECHANIFSDTMKFEKSEESNYSKNSD